MRSVVVDALSAILRRKNLAEQYMLASLAVLAVSMLLVGWWVGAQIELGVISRTAATTALYVDSFVAPQLQSYGTTGALTPAEKASLDTLVHETAFGRRIVAFKVWEPSGRVLYGTEPAAIGEVFPLTVKLSRALGGEVVSGLSNLSNEENEFERARYSSLIESYSPVFRAGSSQVLAVVEFYQTADDLQAEISAARARSWLVVAAVTALTYLLLAGIVRRGSNTISQQQARLAGQVAGLTSLMHQNERLSERVRRAAARTTALNERFLRRLGSELHDGPAQALVFALLRLDSFPRCAEHPSPASHDCPDEDNVARVRSSLRGALEEVRSMATGLRLPELEALSVREVVAQVVRLHEQATGTTVALDLGSTPEQTALPVKITLYRIVQEALANAYRHAGGKGQEVRLSQSADRLEVLVCDRGPGFDWQPGAGERLGLVGMRERAESLGGRFRLESQLGRGTRIVVELPLSPPADLVEPTREESIA